MTEYITHEMEQIRIMIAQTFAKREMLKNEMKEWYDNNNNKKFLNLKDLIAVDNTLSELDSHYKRLWDIQNSKKI